MTAPMSTYLDMLRGSEKQTVRVRPIGSTVESGRYTGLLVHPFAGEATYYNKF
jgi:hypothetical protein